MVAEARGVTVIAAGSTDVGHGRDENEDAILLCADVHLYLVADGTGGLRDGASAGEIAVNAVAAAFRASAGELGGRYDARDATGLYVAARRLVSAVQAGNQAVAARRVQGAEADDFGATLVAALLSPSTATLHVAHVGDSRCYRWRGRELERLTEDHTILHEILETRPDLEDSVLARLPRHAVTRGLGMAETVRVSVRTIPLRAGDRYVLASDGLTDALPDEQLADVLRGGTSPRKTARALVDAANIACTSDNVTAVVLSCRPRKKKSVDAARKAPAPPPDVRLPSRTSVYEGSSPEIFIESVMQQDAPTKRKRDTD